MKWTLSLVLIWGLYGCASAPIYLDGTVVEGITACSERYPRCVSSLNVKQSFYIKPIATDGLSAVVVIERLKLAMAKEKRAQLVFESTNQLEYVVTTALARFKDDVSFAFDADKNQVLMRSGARIGYFDWHVNRRRLERVRSAFLAQ